MESPTRRLTLAALGISAIILGYAEYRALLDGRQDDTISEQVWKANEITPLVPFLSGLVCGHFFWQRKNKTDG